MATASSLPDLSFPGWRYSEDNIDPPEHSVKVGRNRRDFAQIFDYDRSR
jgi:hypothetical protein